jgi:hypothetical protein
LLFEDSAEMGGILETEAVGLAQQYHLVPSSISDVVVQAPLA